jgi:succinate-acetate transporter protein
MDDEVTLWTILGLYLLVAGLIGGLLPTWPLSVTATSVFALGVLLLVLVNAPEVSWDVAQLLIAIAIFVGSLAHLVRRIARVWWREKAN